MSSHSDFQSISLLSSISPARSCRCTEASDLRSRARHGKSRNCFRGNSFSAVSHRLFCPAREHAQARHSHHYGGAAVDVTLLRRSDKHARKVGFSRRGKFYVDLIPEDWAVHQSTPSKPSPRQEQFSELCHSACHGHWSSSRDFGHVPQVLRRNGHRVIFVMPWVRLKEQAGDRVI